MIRDHRDLVRIAELEGLLRKAAERLRHNNDEYADNHPLDSKPAGVYCGKNCLRCRIDAVLPPKKG